jgi:L-alanine-DL-glutamate epimerase-like enolase superfamily enzyme
MAIIREVKKQVGDNLVLMLDFMWSYHYEEAAHV